MSGSFHKQKTPSPTVHHYLMVTWVWDRYFLHAITYFHCGIRKFVLQVPSEEADSQISKASNNLLLGLHRLKLIESIGNCNSFRYRKYLSMHLGLCIDLSHWREMKAFGFIRIRM